MKVIAGTTGAAQTAQTTTAKPATPFQASQPSAQRGGGRGGF